MKDDVVVKVLAEYDAAKSAMIGLLTECEGKIDSIASYSGKLLNASRNLQKAAGKLLAHRDRLTLVKKTRRVKAKKTTL